MTSLDKVSQNKRTGGVAQVIECLSNKYETLSSVPATTERRRRRRKKRRRRRKRKNTISHFFLTV
jgi:hypothetical protein